MIALTLAASAFAACDQPSAAVEFRSGEACANIVIPEHPSDFAGAVELGEIFVFQGEFHYASTGSTPPDSSALGDPSELELLKTFHAGDAVAVREAGELVGAIKLIGSGDDDEPTFVATQGVNAKVLKQVLASARAILECQWAARTAFNTCYDQTGNSACCTGKYLGQLAACNLPWSAPSADLGDIWAAECETQSGGGADGDGGGDGNEGGIDCGEGRHVVDAEVHLGGTVCEYTGWVQPVADGDGGCVDTYQTGVGGIFSNCQSTGAIDLDNDEQELENGCGLL